MNPMDLPEGFSPLAVNCDLSRINTLRKRKGTARYGNDFNDNEQVQAIINYNKSNGDEQGIMIKGGALYKYDGSKWVLIQANVVDKGKHVAITQFNQKIYFCSKDSFLQSTDGTTVTDAQTGADRIKGTALATGQNVLFIGNVTANATLYSNRVYYSYFDDDTLSKTDQFFNPNVGSGNLATSNRYFEFEGGEIKALVSFSNRDRVYIFTATTCYTFDIAVATTNPGRAVQQVFDIGCAGPNAAKVIDGVLYWMDNKGKIWAWNGGTNRPEELSYFIDDDELNESIISSIDKSVDNMLQICAFGISKLLYFSVGSLSVNNAQIPNACIKMVLSANGLRAFVTVDSFPERILVSDIVSDNNQNIIVAGTATQVIQLRKGLNDITLDNTEKPVSFRYQTRAEDFGEPHTTKQVQHIEVRYRPQEKDSNLDIAIYPDTSVKSINVVKKDLPKKHGSLNMRGANPNDREKIKLVYVPENTTGDTFIVEFSNDRLNEPVEIYSYAMNNTVIKTLNVPVS